MHFYIEMFLYWVDKLFIENDLVLYFPVHKDEISNHSWFSNGGPHCGGRSTPQHPKSHIIKNLFL